MKKYLIFFTILLISKLSFSSSPEEVKNNILRCANEGLNILQEKNIYFDYISFLEIEDNDQAYNELSMIIENFRSDFENEKILQIEHLYREKSYSNFLYNDLFQVKTSTSFFLLKVTSLKNIDFVLIDIHNEKISSTIENSINELENYSILTLVSDYIFYSPEFKNEDKINASLILNQELISYNKVDFAIQTIDRSSSYCLKPDQFLKVFDMIDYMISNKDIQLNEYQNTRLMNIRVKTCSLIYKNFKNDGIAIAKNIDLYINQEQFDAAQDIINQLDCNLLESKEFLDSYLSLGISKKLNFKNKSCITLPTKTDYTIKVKSDTIKIGDNFILEVFLQSDKYTQKECSVLFNGSPVKISNGVATVKFKVGYGSVSKDKFLKKDFELTIVFGKNKHREKISYYFENTSY